MYPSIFACGPWKKKSGDLCSTRKHLYLFWRSRSAAHYADTAINDMYDFTYSTSLCIHHEAGHTKYSAYGARRSTLVWLHSVAHVISHPTHKLAFTKKKYNPILQIMDINIKWSTSYCNHIYRMQPLIYCYTLHRTFWKQK